jgi:mono/diheme cytochrome c family protein
MSRHCVLVLLATASLSAQGPYERQRIDAAAADRGRAAYARYCLDCHGGAAKGSARGPDLIRSETVLRDRYGDAIGAAIKPSAAHTAALTAAQIEDLSHFLHQRVEAVARNRNPTAPLNVLTGDPEAGRRYFNAQGQCAGCHSPSGDLAGIATRIGDPATLQQRFLFPTLRPDGRARVEVSVTTATGKQVSGLLVRADDFVVLLRDESGDVQSFARGPQVVVAIHDPLAVHHDLLERYTDADMHNVTAYLATLK